MINCIIGAGIFGTPSKAYALTGSYSLLAFVACALVVAIIAFCYAEVASRFTETGGPYLYARVAFGPVVGFQVGWLAWVARLSSFAFICNVLVSYLSFFWSAATSGLLARSRHDRRGCRAHHCEHHRCPQGSYRKRYFFDR